MRLGNAVIAAARAYPLERKRLVGRRQGEVRELLRMLAVDGHAWIGFEPATPLALARELALPKLTADGLTTVDEFDEAALIDEAFDAAIAEGPAAPLAALADGVGLRRELAGTVRALRLAGARPSDLPRAGLRDEAKAAALAAVLAGYERALDATGRVDAAAVFRRATAAIAGGTAIGRVYLMPGLRRDGLPGRFVRALIDAGATVLPDESVAGLEPPRGWITAPPAQPAQAVPSARGFLHAPALLPARAEPDLTLFTAASIADELREVLRRVMARGLAWDEVEIVATDAATYGVALDAIARPLGIPITYAVGLPFERTRPGRVVRAYLDWIRADFPDDILRGLLEREDLVAAGGPSGAVLARRLRALRIGRGRDRYDAAFERARHALRIAEAAAAVEPGRDAPEDAARRLAQDRLALDALAEIAGTLLDATPPLPDRLRTDDVRVRPADLARALLAALRFTPSGDAVDAAARARLVTRLERIAATSTRATGLDAAIATLLGRLDTRVPAPDADGTAPWSSAGGHIHFTDIAHGGLTGRPAVFVVGLDGVRFPGGDDETLLDDDDRRRLAGIGRRGLPDATERGAERRYALATLLARARGSVTLSHAAWDAVQVRAVPPAADLLQAHRLQARRPLDDYEAMRAAIGAPATAVPAAARLDASDVWLARLRAGGIARIGTGIVREAFPGLDRGLRAAAARAAREFTPHHGRVLPRESLDPRRTGEPLSASRLETLGTCPRRYLLRYVLRVYAPDDLDLEPDRWLSPLDRGLLLHRVFERTLRRARDAGADGDAAATEAIGLAVLEVEIAKWRERVPPPGAAVFDAEAAALREDVRAFARMAAEADGRWIELERRFGRGGEPALRLATPRGELGVTGAIDRIDELSDGRLAVIDYKTGGYFDHGRGTGVYNGGRRLQHAVYTAAARALLGRDVARAEYHYPSVRGENRVARYDAALFADGLAVINELLDVVAAGLFHPTPDPGDCASCDYRVVCRVRQDRFNKLTSPAAEWASEMAGELEELSVIAGLRAAGSAAR